jgi:hypothetical protein
MVAPIFPIASCRLSTSDLDVIDERFHGIFSGSGLGSGKEIYGWRHF